MRLFGKTLTLPTIEEALPGRPEAMVVPARHEVLGTPLEGPWPAGLDVAYFALGCFWGAEEIYWQLPGVHSTAVGYQGGLTPNPTYEEACTGRTGHTEAVLVVHDPAVVPYAQLLKVFWESHDSTSGMRQGNDIGTQYRSAVYTTTPEQLEAAKASRDVYQGVLAPLGYDPISTEILPAGPFYYAEAHHQQYLHKNPHGYRCHSETGVAYPA
ncbi:MAG TPA: peptide-methionine (S)-S-oxide reductase MsrA [Mycobacteriales bacterium]|nr:peptide-methionine (S)-S-oxide reductase MsrA [Mycobacteriales bacterium]